MKLSPDSSKLVFIDIDGTLVSPPTVWHFYCFCIKNKIVPKRSLAHACYQFLMNKFNCFNQAEAIEHWLNFLVGIDADTFRTYCRQTFEDRIRQTFIPTMLNKIVEHKKRGDHMVIISSTIQCFAEIISELLELDHYYSLEVILEENRLTKKTVLPIPYHHGKVYYAKEYASKLNMNLEDAYFYTDSISDLPLLKEVGYPIPINPDRYLRQIALISNWNILQDNKRVDIFDFINK